MMKNLPDKKRPIFATLNEQTAVYEVPSILFEGKISTRAQSEPGPQGGRSVDASDDPFHG